MLHLAGSSHCSSRPSTVKVKLFRIAVDPKETELFDLVVMVEVWKLLGRDNSMIDVVPDDNVIRTKTGDIPEVQESSHHSITRTSFPLISTIQVFSSDVELKVRSSGRLVLNLRSESLWNCPTVTSSWSWLIRFMAGL